MTDRELLEFAAKAAGIELANTKPDYPLWIKGKGEWNPLTDDGDAFRLVVELRMAVDIGGGGEVEAICRGPACKSAIEDVNPDPLAATRRAIVRAAAEIGKE